MISILVKCICISLQIILKGKGRTSRPLPGNIVTVRCEGRLASGTVVDKHEKLQFILSDEDVIQGKYSLFYTGIKVIWINPEFQIFN